MTQLVAFLRGINLGKRKVKMEDLRASFARAGFEGAKTLLASGNVVFDGDNRPKTEKAIEQQLKSDFGFEIETMLRSMNELKAIADPDPFADFDEKADIKRYVYFLRNPETDKLALPAKAKDDYEIVTVTEREIFAVGLRTPEGRYGPGLDALPKPFGHEITNRNWNTVLRLIDMAD